MPRSRFVGLALATLFLVSLTPSWAETGMYWWNTGVVDAPLEISGFAWEDAQPTGLDADTMFQKPPGCTVFAMRIENPPASVCPVLQAWKTEGRVQDTLSAGNVKDSSSSQFPRMRMKQVKVLKVDCRSDVILVRLEATSITVD